MNVSQATSLVDSLLDRSDSDAIQNESRHRVSEVLILAHVLERNLSGAPELKHALTFARSFAATNCSRLALTSPLHACKHQKSGSVALALERIVLVIVEPRFVRSRLVKP